MKTCSECGAKLGLFESGRVCKPCTAKQRAALAEKQKQELEAKERESAARRARVAAVETKFLGGPTVPEEDVTFLRFCPREDIIALYGRLLQKFEQDEAFSEREVLVLNSLQQTFTLTNAEVDWEAKVAPYYYAYMISEQHKLPTVVVSIEDGAPVILKDGEIVHYFDQRGVMVTESQSVSLGYSGSSQGISFAIPGLKGIRYRIGSHRGQMMKQEQQVTIAGGFLVVTNQRLMVYPMPGYAPISIPLKKILHYSAYENGIEVFTEGRHKPYSLRFVSSSGVELAGLCLSFLLAPPK